MKPSVVLTFLLFAHLSALATDYYIANNGSDSNSGTASNAPWRTLEKLSAELGGPSGTWGTITSGDRVFFQRGDVFRGSIAFAAYNNNGITFDAYGAGGKPVIKGSVPVTEWTPHSGNIWKATVPQRVYFLYQGGTAQTLARAPNSGHWTATSASGSSLTGNDIGASGLDLVGANVCIREYDWQLNRQVISGQSGNTVDWSSAIGGTPSDDSNVYFDNKLELLDAVGEWYWDAATTTLYYMTDGTDPTSLTVEASVYLVGIAGNDNRSNNAFRNLYFAHYAQEGIRLMGASDNNTIDNCTFSDNFQALFLSGSGANVQNNDISASYLQGVVLANMGNSTFSNNTVSDAGMVYGKHRPDFTGEFYSGGIWLINGNAGSVISYNTVSSTGGMGIRFNGSGVIIERNSVNNAMANMDDGGGIYTWGGNNSSYSNTIRYNVVSNMTGSHNGTPPGNIVNGIYIDNYAYNITLEKNTIQNIPNGSGIVINAGAHGCTVTGNVTHGCSRGLGMYDWLPGQSVYGNTLSGNTFYANTQDAVPVEIASDDNNYNVFAASDNNFLINPYDTHVVRYLWSSNQTFTLPQWRTATGLDMASVGTYYVWTFPTDYSFVATNDSPAPAVRNFSNVRDLNNMNVTQVTLPPFSS